MTELALLTPVLLHLLPSIPTCSLHSTSLKAQAAIHEPLLGHLGGSISGASGSWFQLRLWSRGSEDAVEPRVSL